MTTPDLSNFLSDVPPAVAEWVLQARVLILSVMPHALEMIDPPSRIIAYGLGSKNAELICAVAPYRTYLNLIFSQGAQLSDPTHLLQGTGKYARHIKIQQAADLQAPAVRALLLEALEKMQ